MREISKGQSRTVLALSIRKTPGYCWRIYFKVLGVLFLGEVFPAFWPSKKACGIHTFRHLGVRQQYPPVICTHDKRANPGARSCTETPYAKQRPDGGRPGSLWMACGREHLAGARWLPL